MGLGVYLQQFLSFQCKMRNNNVTPHQAGDLHFYMIHEYRRGGQGGDFSAVKHGLSLNFSDNYMILFGNLRKRGISPAEDG